MPAITLNRDEIHLGYIDLSQKELRNPVFQQLGADPGTPAEGQFYELTTTHKIKAYLNSQWEILATMNDVTAGGISSTLFDAKGDILVGTANDTVARKAVGSNGTLLVADSAQSDGLNWRALLDADIPSTIARDAEALLQTLADAKGDLPVATAADTWGALTAGTNGTFLVAASGQATGLQWRNIVPADSVFAATDKLLGRDTASGGAGEEIAVTGGIVFTGSGGIQTTAFTGDVTKTLGGTALTIAANAVTNAQAAQMAAATFKMRALGAGTGDPIDGTVAQAKAALLYTGTDVSFTPAQGIAATNVQTAIEEAVTDLTALINTTVEARTWKNPVDAATTGVLPNTPTYSSGAGTLTAGSNTTLAAQDGVTLVLNEDLLVKDQASSFQDGIYTLTAIGSGAAPWVLTRRADANTAAELQDATVMVEAGTTLGGDIFTQTVSTLADLTAATQTWTKTGNTNTVYTDDGSSTLLTGSAFSVKDAGVTSAKLAAAVAGNGLTGGAGAPLAVVGTASRISVAADSIDIDSAYAGQNTITILGTVATGTWSATTIAANKGGTGQTSYAVGDIVYADTTATLAKLADAAVGNVLISGGANTAPSYGKVGLTTHVSGTLAATSGGTGRATYTVGDLIQSATTDTLTVLAAVATGNVLISGGVTTVSSWGKVGLTTHVSGTLAIGSGGTGQTTAPLALTALGGTALVQGALTGGANFETVTHSLGRQWVDAFLINNSSPYDRIDVYYECTDTNNVKFYAASGGTLTAGYRWVVMG